MSNRFPKLPSAIAPPLRQRRANEPYTVFEGAATYIAGDARQEIPTRLTVEWLPDPRIRVTAGPCDSTLFDFEGEVRMQLDDSSARVLLLEYSWSDETVRGTVQGPLCVPEFSNCQAIYFGLVNFHDYLGAPVASERKMWRGRLEVRCGDSLLTIDQVENFPELAKSLKGEGGFAVTHGGQYARVDGGQIPREEVEDVCAALHFLLGFVRGHWTGPVAVTSGNAPNTGAVILQNWNVTRLTSVGSWFPRETGPPDLDHVVTQFMTLWRRPEWTTPLKHYVWWYIEANTARSLESAIMTSQTGLELMGWVQLVETRQIVSSGGYNDLPAADKVRILLSDLRIPCEIPDHLIDLKRYASAHGMSDGPGCIVDLRNAIMHPSLKKRNRLASASNRAKFEAAQLARQYLEYVLLAMLGYSGSVRDRTVATRGYPLEIRAPWVARTGAA